MKRKTTDEEKALFKAHIDEPRALKAVAQIDKKRKRTPAHPPPKREALGGGGGRSTDQVRRPVGANKAEGVNQIDGNTAKKLKRGEIAPGARIDLHGMTESTAHGALLSFLAAAQGRGVRLALVITGTGNPRDQDSAEWMRSRHGVLKDMVPRWLNEQAFAALVSGSAPSHRRHGGAGALYVYLRKSR